MSVNRNLAMIPEIRNKILFTIFIMVVYRLGAFIPTPGINAAALADFFASNQNTLLGFVNLFSGGALERFSIFALGIMPYITVSIVIQIMTAAYEPLERLQKEGELGRRKITQYTRYGTVVLAILQGLFMAMTLEKNNSPGSGVLIVENPGMMFRIMTVITFTAGTVFLMWLGEMITERGIGNGISLIIYAGIIVQIGPAIGQSLQLIQTQELGIVPFLFLLVLAASILAGIVFMETAYRKIPIQYAKRVAGRKVYGGQSTHLPLKVNVSGVIPPIFASSMMMFPLTIAQFADGDWAQTIQNSLNPTGFGYNAILIVLIIFFAFFYTSIQYNPDDVADNLKKSGGFIPGIRPGSQTADRINIILMRITTIGALYLAAVCVVPAILVRQFNAPFWYGGTSLLIVVGVALDTLRQIESKLMAHSYDGLMGQGQAIRGRSRGR